jgi:hypothetical protein
MRTVGKVAVVMAVLVSLAASARAEDADALLRRGTELRRSGRDREALAEFQKAAAINETPRVLAQIALAEQALGIWIDAEAHLKKALASENDLWIRKNTSALDGALKVIKQHLASIEVWGGPDGAEVLLDSKVVGHLPSVDAVRVDAEEVFLQVRAPGYVTLERTLKVQLGGLLRERVELRPVPPPQAAPPAADVADSAPAAGGAQGARVAADHPVASREAPPPVAAPERGPLAVDASVGPRIVSRDLSWNKDIKNVLGKISQGGEPAVGGELAWYPGAHFTRTWPASFGVVFSAEYAPGTTIATSNGRFGTTDSDYWGGLRLRLPIGVGDAAVTFGLGQQVSLLQGLDGTDRTSLNVPDVRYSYLRAGFDLRIYVPAGVGVLVGAAYRDVSGAGTGSFEAQSTDFFPRLTTTGLEVSAAIGYRFVPSLEGRIGFDVRRYGLDTHPQNSDPVLVSGALDQYVSFWLSLGVLIDGAGGESTK